MNPRRPPQDGASSANAACDRASWQTTSGDDAQSAPRAPGDSSSAGDSAVREKSLSESGATRNEESLSGVPEPGSGILDDVALDHAGLDEAGSSELLPVGLSGDGSAGEFTDDGDDERLLRLARDGDRGSFERLFSRYREDLRRVVAWRTDPRLRARVDPSDVVQDAQLEAFRRLDDFLRRRPMGFRLWLRKTAQEQLAKAFRRHVGTQMRSAGRETSLNDSESPGIGAIAAAADTPSQHMAAQEAAQAVWEGLAELAEHDREILIMRNYEGLNYDEICVVLDIEPAAARKRYGRALLRLRQRLAARGLTEEESQ